MHAWIVTVSFVLFISKITVFCHLVFTNTDSRLDVLDHELVRDRAYPYVVAVLFYDMFLCTGTLLTNSWVITAATPILTSRIPMGSEDLRVRLGSNDRAKGGSVLKVTQFQVHPSAKESSPEFDVALLTLEYNVKVPIGKAQTVFSLAKKKCHILKFVVPSWLHDESTKPKPDILRHSLYYTMSRDTCRKTLSKYNVTLTKNIACLSPSQGSDYCLRDVGAPLIYVSEKSSQLWGIVSSWTAGCGQSAPTLATRLTVDSMKKWIDRVTTA